MSLPDKKANIYSRYVSEFKGLNRLPVNAEGELSSSENMVFDLFPVLSVRNGRTTYQTLTGTPQGIISTGAKLAWVLSGTLYYDGVATGLTGLSDGVKSMVEFWGKIFIFPDGKYYNIADGTYGNIGTDVYPAEGSCPALDYICVHNNRIWGVKGNYIYASSNGWAMGAADSSGRYGWTQWYDANGNIDDNGSFYQQVASSGDFTGIASWDNRIVALKERCHHEIQGSYPSNFTLSTISKFGTFAHESIQEVNSKLYYVCPTGVLVYGGGLESDSSRKLNEAYKGAVAGTDGLRYYLCLDNGEDSKKLYVYHTLLDLWTEEDSLNVVDFCQHKGQLYAMCADGKIIIMGDPDSTETVNWGFEFNDYAEKIFTDTRISKIIVKAEGESGASMSIEMSSNDGEFETLKTVDFPNDILHSAAFKCTKGQKHTFRITGQGQVQFYGVWYKSEPGGENIV